MAMSNGEYAVIVPAPYASALVQSIRDYRMRDASDADSVTSATNRVLELVSQFDAWISNGDPDPANHADYALWIFAPYFQDYRR